MVVLRLSSYETDTLNRVPTLHEVVCISHSAISLRKGMYQTVLHPARGRYKADWDLKLVTAPGVEERKL